MACRREVRGMASNRAQQLAERLHLAVVSAGQPLNGACVAGLIEGFPVAISWGKRQNRSSVLFLVRFRKNSLRLSPGVFAERIAGSTEVLGAMERKKLSGAEIKALGVGPDSVLFFWDYTLRAPQPGAVAAVARRLVELVKTQAEQVLNQCEVCGRSGVGELFSVSQVLMSVCSGCRERMGEEDRRAVETYEALPANPMLGTMAGA